MFDWELTATTIFCDFVDDEATVIVFQNGTTNCTGIQKYAQKEALKDLKKKSRQTGKTLACKGKTCPIVKKYRSELMKKK